jgi:hypothetical protein
LPSSIGRGGGRGERRGRVERVSRKVPVTLNIESDCRNSIYVPRADPGSLQGLVKWPSWKNFTGHEKGEEAEEEKDAQGDEVVRRGNNHEGLEQNSFSS